MNQGILKNLLRLKSDLLELWDSLANRVIRILILGNVVTISAWGFSNPVFAVYVTRQIQDGSMKTVGFAAAIYWLVKSIAQIFIARYLDKADGETDDFYSLIIGNALIIFVPLGYIFANEESHIYLLGAVLGFGNALFVPAWHAIFTRHIDQDRISLEWTFNSIGIGIGTALSAAVGGIIADKYGFIGIFLLTALFQGFSTLAFAFLARDFAAGTGRLPQQPVSPQEVGIGPHAK